MWFYHPIPSSRKRLRICAIRRGHRSWVSSSILESLWMTIPKWIRRGEWYLIHDAISGSGWNQSAAMAGPFHIKGVQWKKDQEHPVAQVWACQVSHLGWRENFLSRKNRTLTNGLSSALMSLPWGVYKFEHQAHGDWRYALVFVVTRDQTWARKRWKTDQFSNNTWRLTDHQRNLTDQARNGTSRVNQRRWSSWWLVGWRGISHLKDAYFTEENNLYMSHTYWCCPIMIDSSIYSFPNLGFQVVMHISALPYRSSSKNGAWDKQATLEGPWTRHGGGGPHLAKLVYN